MVLAVAACQGIPLRSVPRLYKLQSELLSLDPAALRVAVQVDGRLAPPAESVPYLVIKLIPVRADAFKKVDRRLPMSYMQTAGTVPGLPLPGAQRRWLVYGLTLDAQVELRTIQVVARQWQAKDKNGGGTLSLGIDQSGLAVKTPGLAETRWESWLQVSAQDGFFELWSGTVADLLRQARAAEAAQDR